MPAPCVRCSHCQYHGPALQARVGVQPWFVLLGLTGIGLLSALVSLVIAAHARRPTCPRCLRIDGLQDDWTAADGAASAEWQQAKQTEARRFAAQQWRNWLLFAGVVATDAAVIAWLVRSLLAPQT